MLTVGQFPGGDGRGAHIPKEEEKWREERESMTPRL
jgi:hypothetical protein